MGKSHTHWTAKAIRYLSTQLQVFQLGYLRSEKSAHEFARLLLSKPLKTPEEIKDPADHPTVVALVK